MYLVCAVIHSNGTSIASRTRCKQHRLKTRMRPLCATACFFGQELFSGNMRYNQNSGNYCRQALNIKY